MLIQQEITQFKGFGQGNILKGSVQATPLGKYSFSSGFKRTDNGAAPAWNITGSSGSYAGLIQWFADLNGQVWSTTESGNLYVGGSVQRTVSGGQGLIVDQKNRLLYARAQYLGSLDGITYNDTWKDFGVSYSVFRPMELFEDMVLIGNKNNVAALFTDDSFSTNAFSLPTDFEIRCIKSGKRGILIGANFQNRGYLVLWDGYSTRSIAPWIYLPSTISSITTDESGTWIVTAANGFFLTDGYTLQPYASLPNVKINNAILASVLPSGTLYHQGRLLVSFNPPASYTPMAKMPMGVLIYDSASQLWEVALQSTNYQTKGKMGALFLDSSLNINVGYSTVTPAAAQYAGKVKEDYAPKAVLITEELGQGNNPKYAEALIASIRFSPNESTRYTTPAWTLTAKIYDFKRQLYGYGLTVGASANTNEIRNTGGTAAYQSAQVGDEITILNGANAGLIRTITAISNAGTNSELWTLDSALPNLTETGVDIQIMPFKLISSKTISTSEDYFFNIKNRTKGKRFLAKLILETSDTNIMLPELTGTTFIYDDNATQ
jgi:hypothetical protein